MLTLGRNTGAQYCVNTPVSLLAVSTSETAGWDRHCYDEITSIKK